MFPVTARLASLAAIALLLVSAHPKVHSPAVMAETAKAFLASLTPDQQAKAKLDLHSERRVMWHFVPDNNYQEFYKMPRRGLNLRDMTPSQQHLAHALLSACLSQRGYRKAVSIMSLEEVLREIEGDSGERRNPMKYYFTIFGEPSETGAWALSVEGHHLSLNFVIASGRVSGAPTFFGSNPAEVRQGPRKGWRILAREEDLARDLLASLTPEQKKTAIVDGKAYPDILTSVKRKAALDGQPSGLHAAKMTPKQRELLAKLLDEYVFNLPEEVAAARLDQIKKAGPNLHFAWAGVEERGGPHYYRVQGPSFLVEYDNTQNNANHIHSVWRDLNGDFGDDVLKAHYEESHSRRNAE
jgi:hypothetical protein